MTTYNYRTCTVCGEKWNVSIHNRQDRYICPVCRKKNKDTRIHMNERSC